MEMEAEMLNTETKPYQITPLLGRYRPKYYVIWRSDEFSWNGRTIPHTALYGTSFINSTRLDLAIEQEASPQNSYRIASISKTITAMGIAEMINRRLLTLDTKVFGVKGILSSLDVRYAHPWLRSITIRHLLEHSTGGWHNTERIEFNRMPQTSY
ncbi:hypothetical protein DICVIV_07425 [Dictyocaulus viviparus]|uniref:Beta-lactamase-related domain-containing protein n=1 Tax=Dictyocaulus viviparus TaxID=29172 RepID=A0A0D8XVY5_DICVI|nr:hypothetical protein DICVIV_07425 [Dictyocaulus viviparus]